MLLCVLISSGAHIHAVTLDGWTPLHSAALWDQHKVRATCPQSSRKAVEILLCAGADVNACTHGGQTALHLACERVCVHRVPSSYRSVTPGWPPPCYSWRREWILANSTQRARQRDKVMFCCLSSNNLTVAERSNPWAQLFDMADPCLGLNMGSLSVESGSHS